MKTCKTCYYASSPNPKSIELIFCWEGECIEELNDEACEYYKHQEGPE